MYTKASQIMKNLQKDFDLGQGASLPDHIAQILPTGNYFQVSELQRKKLTSKNIYSDEDFIFYSDKTNARSPVTVKMGNLLIEYSSNGKGSYTLDVQFLDKNLEKTIPMFHFDGDRYPSILFIDIAPFSLGDAATTILRSTDKELALVASANQVRDALTEMALGKPFTTQQFKERADNFLTDLRTFNERAATPVQGEMDFFLEMIDERHQSKHESREPKANHSAKFFQTNDPQQQEIIPEEIEFAKKIAGCFTLIGGVNEEQVKKIVSEYLANDPTEQRLKSMDQVWVESIMTTPILPCSLERGRFCLGTMFQKERLDVTLNKIIQEIKDNQPEEPSASAKK